ncbi:MAG: hypothetical protein ACYC36_00140 [Bellilinea sp.]
MKTKIFTTVASVLVILAVFLLRPQNTGQSAYTADVLSTAYPFPTWSYVTPTVYDYDAWVQTAYPVIQITAVTQVPTAPPPFNDMPQGPYDGMVIDPLPSDMSTTITATEAPAEITMETIAPLQRKLSVWARFVNALKQMFLSWR